VDKRREKGRKHVDKRLEISRKNVDKRREKGRKHVVKRLEISRKNVDKTLAISNGKKNYKKQKTADNL